MLHLFPFLQFKLEFLRQTHKGIGASHDFNMIDDEAAASRSQTQRLLSVCESEQARHVLHIHTLFQHVLTQLLQRGDGVPVGGHQQVQPVLPAGFLHLHPVGVEVPHHRMECHQRNSAIEMRNSRVIRR